MPIVSGATGGSAGGLSVIADSTLGGSQATFDTNTILGGVLPVAYSHLRAVIYGRSSNAAVIDTPWLRMNNDSGANYDEQHIQGVNGGAPATTENLAQTTALCGVITAATASANAFGMTTVDILNYQGTVGFKTFIGYGSGISAAAAGAFTFYVGGEWRSTAAITRLTFGLASGSYIAGSRFTLYGLI